MILILKYYEKLFVYQNFDEQILHPLKLEFAYTYSPQLSPFQVLKLCILCGRLLGAYGIKFNRRRIILRPFNQY